MIREVLARQSSVILRLRLRASVLSEALLADDLPALRLVACLLKTAR